MNDSKTTTFTIDRFEGGKAVLIAERFKVIVPKKIVPKDCQEGDVIHLTLASHEAETKKREKRAKEILNELLKG